MNRDEARDRLCELIESELRDAAKQDVWAYNQERAKAFSKSIFDRIWHAAYEQGVNDGELYER